MKKLLAIVLASASVFAGCTESEMDDSRTEVRNGTPVFSVSLADVSDTRVGMTLLSEENKYKLYWQDDDPVMICSTLGETAAWSKYIAVPDPNDASTAVLIIDDTRLPVEGATQYEAFYPYSLVAGENHTLTLPATVTGTTPDIPLYAQSTTTSLDFYNLCSVLQFNVTPDIAATAEVSLSSTKKISGEFTLDVDANSKYYLKPTDQIDTGDTKISLGEISFNGPTTFRFVLPAGTYSAQDLSLTIGERTLVLQQAITLQRGVVKSFDLNFSFWADGSAATEDLTVDDSGEYSWTYTDPNERNGSTEDLTIDNDGNYYWQDNTEKNGSTEDLTIDNSGEYDWSDMTGRGGSTEDLIIDNTTGYNWE